MHLTAIAVYHRDRRDRPNVLRFGGGRLNVVSGVPSRGKSALLEIVDYCLGREEFTVPEGVVRDTVSWYGVSVEHEGERTWLLRPAPRAGAETTSDMMLIPDAHESPPRFGELAVNADRSAARAHLDSRLGIESGAIQRDEMRLRPGLRVSIAQAVLLCMQGQNEVMNKTQLFHRQENEHVRDDLQAALPYLLGAVDPESPALRAALVKARRQLERADRRLNVARTAGERADDRALSLLQEAAAVGLGTDDTGDPLARLRSSAEASLDDSVARVGDDPAAGLLERQRELLARRADLRRQLRSLRTLDDDARAFAGEAGEQAARLRSLELLPHADRLTPGASCPVCGSDSPHDDASAAEFASALAALSEEIERATGFAPRATRAIAELEERRQSLDDELASVGAALRDLAEQGNRIARDQDAARTQAFVQGRITEYLAVSERASLEALASLEAAVATADTEVARLAEQMDPEGEQQRTEAALDELSDVMTHYARALEVEHVDPPSRLRLNLERMTVVSRGPHGSKWLPNIGGGSNWLGWHLATHLALHTYFIRQERPVPRFLMLDQPTQAFYPEDLKPGEVPEDEDVDRTSVRRMFRLLYEVAAETGLQIIVCDHAKLREEDWFMQSLQYDWRGADGLVPANWQSRAIG